MSFGPVTPVVHCSSLLVGSRYYRLVAYLQHAGSNKLSLYIQLKKSLGDPMQHYVRKLDTYNPQSQRFRIP